MNKTIKKDSKNEFPSVEEENKIIEEIIRNQIINGANFNKEFEDFEEDDENDDDILEKDKITEEILDNKLSFIIPEENEKIEEDNNKNKRKIHKDIIEDLLIDLFNYHYNGIIGQKRKNPHARIFATKYHIEFFYTKLNINFVNFSKYILLILEQKIDELIEYIKKRFCTKKITIKDILDIKKSLCLVGINIGKIFELPFEKTRNFDISSVLEVLFITEILNDNDIDINDEDYEEIINISKLDEKDNFEKYVEECKTYFEKIENGEKEEEDVEVEEEKLNEEKEQTNNQNEKIDINEDKNKINNEENNLQNDKENINNIKIENEEKNDSDKDINNINIIEKNESLSMDDLLKYINGTENKKKKKKKRKKKKKLEEKEYNKIIIPEEKDEIYENFKSYIISFSENLEKNQKIKPHISQAFLDKLL